MRSVKALSEELEVSKQTIFNNIKRLNIETIKQENTSFIKEDSDIEKIVQRVNKNKKKYEFENVAESKQTYNKRVDDIRKMKNLSKELEVRKQTIFNNIKRLNKETKKKENTSFIKEDSDIEKIVQRVNKNKKKYGFENVAESKQKKDPDNIDVESKTDAQIVEILKNQIDTLNNQIEKQESRHETTIEFYRKELQERSKLLENQQVLAL